MSPDDIPAGLFMTIGAVLLSTTRLRRIWAVGTLAGEATPRRRMLWLLGGCGVGLWLVLRFFAAQEVRESIGYQWLFVMAWIVAVDVGARGLALMGLDLEADGFERRNPAARSALAGYCIAVTLGAIGANLGEGDELSTTLFPLGLAVAGVLAVALGMASASRGFATVTVERDAAAGLRMGGLFVAAGVPLARAASGDWFTMGATLRDFGATGPWLIALVVVAVAMEVWWRKMKRGNGREKSAWRERVLPLVAYAGIAALAWRSIR